jgi:REG-2-like HAD superfamily hydrolase
MREVPTRWEIYASVGREFGLDVDTATMHAAMHRAHESVPARVDGHFRYTDGWFRAYLEEVFLGLGLPSERLAAVSERLFAVFRSPGTFVAFPEAAAVLDALRERGLRVGVVSNWSPRLPRILEGLGLASRIDFVLCSAVEEVEKPHAPIFRRALDRAGADPDEAVHVGDSLVKDVEGARAAGIAAVLLDRDGKEGPLARPEPLPDREDGAPAWRVGDLRGILDLLGSPRDLFDGEPS